MRMRILTLIGALAGAIVAAALLVVAAEAAERTVHGPATVRGSGFLQADLVKASGSRAVTLRTKGSAGLYVVPQAKNVTVACAGGSKREEFTATRFPGRAAGPVVACRGTTAGASVKGGSFKLLSMASSYTLVVPKSFTATLGQRAERP
jgi:hypothetical protein